MIFKPGEAIKMSPELKIIRPEIDAEMIRAIVDAAHAMDNLKTEDAKRLIKDAVATALIRPIGHFSNV